MFSFNLELVSLGCHYYSIFLMNENKEGKIRDTHQVLSNKLFEENEQYLTANDYSYEHLKEFAYKLNVKSKTIKYQVDSILCFIK